MAAELLILVGALMAGLLMDDVDPTDTVAEHPPAVVTVQCQDADTITVDVTTKE